MKGLSLLVIFLSALNLFAQQGVLLNPACFNSSGNDYAVRLFNEKLFFVSDYKDSTSVKKKDKYSGYRFTDVLAVSGCRFEEAKLVKNDLGEAVSINSQWYDGPISYSVKDSVLFFSNTSEGYQHGMMGIYWSKQLPDGTFTNPVAFELNGKSYSCMHPFFDDASSMLYFSSDVAGDSTGFDIYRVSFNKGAFGKPEALVGPNSTSNDLFAAVHNGQLYFSSNRKGGQGGLDLYRWDFTNAAEALAEPFNSPFDDFALIYSQQQRGYFSSNRQSEGKQDDIMEFYVPQVKQTPIVADPALQELISKMKKLYSQFSPDSPEAILIAEAIAKLEAQEKQMLALMQEMNKRQQDITTYVDEASFLSFDEKIKFHEDVLEKQAQYTPAFMDKLPTAGQQMIAQQTKATSLFEKQQTAVPQEQVFFEQKLTPFVNNGVIASGDLNEIIAHYQINDAVVSQLVAQRYPVDFYFGFDRFELTPDELSRLTAFAQKVKAYKGVIVIEGHTDSKGAVKYNQQLSLKRANTIAQLLVNAGFDPKTIKVVGYGETTPVADNSTPEGRAKNRRVVVKL
jgi:outer membrane protein OmpA-like peptidoglycan-associated protein